MHQYGGYSFDGTNYSDFVPACSVADSDSFREKLADEICIKRNATTGWNLRWSFNFVQGKKVTKI